MRRSRVPKTPEDVFEIYGPVTPVGLKNQMILMAREGAVDEFLRLLEANLIMEEWEKRPK